MKRKMHLKAQRKFIDYRYVIEVKEEEKNQIVRLNFVHFAKRTGLNANNWLIIT